MVNPNFPDGFILPVKISANAPQPSSPGIPRNNTAFIAEYVSIHFRSTTPLIFKIKITFSNVWQIRPIKFFSDSVR